MSDNLVEALVETFFDPKYNGITLESVSGNPDLELLVDRIKESGSPSVIPFKQGDRVWWHAVSRTEREFRDLLDGLQAFVGATYANLPRVRSKLKTDHPIGRILQEYSGGRVMRFVGKDAELARALVRMFRVWDAMPDRTVRYAESPGVIRRSFEMALNAQDAEAALNSLSALRDTGILTATNDLFLQVQFLSSFGRWSDILGLRNLQDLLVIRRPLSVTDAITRAIYYMHLAEAVCAEHADSVLTLVRDRVVPQYGPFLGEQVELRTGEAWFVRAAVAMVERDRALLNESTKRLAKLQSLGLDMANDWLEGLRSDVSITPPPVTIDRLQLAREALLRNDPAVAIDQAALASKTTETATLMLQAATLLQSAESARVALVCFDALEASDKEDLLNKQLVRRYYEALRPPESTTYDHTLPAASWREWLTRVIEDANWSQSEIVRTAQIGSQEWNLGSLLSESSIVEIARRLGLIPNDRIDAFAQALPYLVETIQADPSYPDPSHNLLYRAVLDHLVLVDAPTANDARVYVDTLPAVLVARLSEEAYSELIENLIDLVASLRASPSPQLLLDFLDALVINPCRNQESQLRALTFVLATEKRYADRWRDSDRRFLVQLAAEMGHAELVTIELPIEESGDESGILSCLAGQYVAIYTLTEATARRVKEILENTVRRIRVEVSHSHVGNDRLRAMAQQADIFVMATASAKHAATGAIMTYRGERTLLRPAGKGSSSMLRELEDYCTGL